MGSEVGNRLRSVSGESENLSEDDSFKKFGYLVEGRAWGWGVELEDKAREGQGMDFVCFEISYNKVHWNTGMQGQ